ncbi:hypothetical protein RhiLY_11602 [Ceratobasidium sp. AG-Ba]|nr:hypothetical protein RhiLY_11602 [Ceratobasidium sp. AG-Ba]
MRLGVELNTLELYIIPEEMEEQEECVLPVLDLTGRDYVEEYLDSAVTLSSFATSSYLFNKYPHHISRLPKLYRLKIKAYSQDDASTIRPRDFTFASLRELHLVGFMSSDIEAKWMMTPMTKNITAFEVTGTRPTLTTQFDSDISLVTDLSGFIASCITEYPKLTMLRLEFDSALRVVKIGEQALQLLSQQPLRQLYLRKVSVADALEDYVVQCVTSLFTDLEVLVWLDFQQWQLEELR